MEKCNSKSIGAEVHRLMAGHSELSARENSWSHTLRQVLHKLK